MPQKTEGKTQQLKRERQEVKGKKAEKDNKESKQSHKKGMGSKATGLQEKMQRETPGEPKNKDQLNLLNQEAPPGQDSDGREDSPINLEGETWEDVSHSPSDTPPIKKIRPGQDLPSPGANPSNPGGSGRNPPNIDAWALIQSLRDELESILNQKLDAQAQRLEGCLERELNKIRSEITSISERLQSLEADLRKIRENISAQDVKIKTVHHKMTSLSLQLLDLENRNRRDNIRVRGIPESVSVADIESTVTSIFNTILERPVEEKIEVDRVHRSLGRRPLEGNRPRDIICKIHHSKTKEEIMRKARLKGPIQYGGASIILLQDLAKKTLDMRREVKPLLEAIVAKGADYRWIFPFGLNIRFRGKFFSLRDPQQLNDLFRFLEIEPITVPDWFSILV